MELERQTKLLTEVTTLLQEWEVAENVSNYNAIPTLTKLADKFEKERENYFTIYPDPFDERQPLYRNPKSKFQETLNLLLQKNFIMKLLNEYLCDGSKFNIAGCRLMLALIPWLGTSKLFQLRQDGLPQRLINWASSHIAPLQSYATGVLATVMEIPEIAIAYRDQNDRLIPIMLQRLRALQTSMRLLPVDNGGESKPERIKLHCDTTDSDVKINFATQQILILRYLTSMGKNQEFACHVFEHKVLDLILWYINVRETTEARLGFEAMKYLAVLFGNTQFTLDFIERTGLECLLDVPRSSILNPGVSLCLYALAQCEKAMERVCLLQKPTLNKLVKYELWLLESSHVSIRCYGRMFLGTSFQFRTILEEFDKVDGLEKFQNAIPSPKRRNENIVGHVCLAYNRYLETHLNIKIENLVEMDQQGTDFIIPRQPHDKAYKPSPNKIQEQIESLIQSLEIVAPWHAVHQLLHFGGIMWLLKTIAFSTRTKNVQSGLDALVIASVNYNVVLALCDQKTVGMTVILKAADGKIVEDSDVQKSALRVIVNCVCVPIGRNSGKGFHSKKFVRKVWETVRMNNGIVVLVKLLNAQTPVSNADCIRALACKALAGLARCKGILNLPIITAEHLQTLIRDPISQEKRHEHVEFQNYVLELLERLGTKPTHTANDFNSAPQSNFAVSFARNQMGYESYALNRKLIHSKFYPIQNITLMEDFHFCTDITFLPGNEYFLTSFSNGEIIKIKIGNTNKQSSFFMPKDCFMTNLEPNRDGTLLLTSGLKINPKPVVISALWSLNVFAMKLPLFSQEYVEFSKTTQDRLIGSRRGLATIFDVNTGSPIIRLNSNVANMNIRNAATFSFNDDLILSDGILFDVRTGQQIHKLDKLNIIKNGVFHPNGLEIVSDCHVWDIRTYRLLKIVPVLRNCHFVFAPVNNVIYATSLNSSFRTVDGSDDYATIAKIYVNGTIKVLAVNEFDTQLALLGNSDTSKCTVTIYDVGRAIDEEDRQESSDVEDGHEYGDYIYLTNDEDEDEDI